MISLFLQATWPKNELVQAAVSHGSHLLTCLAWGSDISAWMNYNCAVLGEVPWLVRAAFFNKLHHMAVGRKWDFWGFGWSCNVRLHSSSACMCGVRELCWLKQLTLTLWNTWMMPGWTVFFSFSLNEQRRLEEQPLSIDRVHMKKPFNATLQWCIARLPCNSHTHTHACSHAEPSTRVGLEV